MITDKKKVLILEDDALRMEQFKNRLQGHDVVHVETATNAIEHLSRTRFDLVLLDHDLGGRQYVDHTDEYEDCGMRVAEWLSSDPRRVRDQGPIIVHSLNGPAAQQMVELITDAIWIPFLWSSTTWSKYVKFPAS